MNFFSDFKDLALSARPTLLEQDAAEVHHFSNPVCGDRVWVKAGLEGDIVSQLAWRNKSCWPVAGCLELLAEEFLGRDVRECLQYSLVDFMGKVEGVPPGKRHAFSLAHRSFTQSLSQVLLEQISERKRVVGSCSEERL